jgi:3-oxoacyl-[acyl-carrier-protein] synthase-1
VAGILQADASEARFLVKLGLKRAGVADDLELSLPATELGDTGAASGAIAIGLAVRAFLRGYARGPRALVWSRSERGQTAAARVEAAPARA